MAHIPWEAKIVYPKSGCCKLSDFQPTLTRPNFCSTHPSQEIHEAARVCWKTYAPHCQTKIWWTNTKCLWCDGGNVYFPSSLAWNARKALWTQSTQRLLLIRCFSQVKKFLPCTHLHMREIGGHGFFVILNHSIIGFLRQGRLSTGHQRIFWNLLPKGGAGFSIHQRKGNQSICFFFLVEWSQPKNTHFLHHIIILSYCITIWWLAGSPLNQITISASPWANAKHVR